MGTYLGVKAVKEKGEHISKSYRVKPGYRTVAILNNGLYEIAGDVTKESEYKAMYAAYVNGTYIKFNLYLLPEEEVKNCPDEGRVFL